MKIRNPVFSLAILAMMTTLFIGAVMAQEAGPALNGNALMMKGWMDYSEWFVIVTLFPTIIMMLFIALSLHIARPMVLRYLNRMTLRLGADLLWEGWIIGRDVLILSAVGLLGVMIVPRVQSDWNTGVFIPAFVLGIITLVYKLATDTDANKTKYMVATGLTALTLVAVLVPYSIGPLWESKGSDFFMSTYLIPLSNADTIKDVKTAMDDAVNAAQKGDNSTALTKAQEAAAAHDRLGDSLKAWDSAKSSQIDDAFNALTDAAKKGDVAGLEAAQNTINQILNEYEATLGVLG
ncbi:MAG: hypothetical protein O8C66_09340 [Candidatus Methanoperedens sp.]|nr:hypothetical protein [Candidatus Methanoperedens sp.]MCZ7370698.1 hypothetical protein [Candidatus Methanoperedens sp.]